MEETTLKRKAIMDERQLFHKLQVHNSSEEETIFCVAAVNHSVITGFNVNSTKSGGMKCVQAMNNTLFSLIIVSGYS